MVPPSTGQRFVPEKRFSARGFIHQLEKAGCSVLTGLNDPRPLPVLCLQAAKIIALLKALKGDVHCEMARVSGSSSICVGRLKSRSANAYCDLACV
jgi:hypothetical protein